MIQETSQIAKNMETAKGVMEKHLGKITDLVKVVVSGYSDSLILISDGGLGKSFTVLETLKEKSMEENRDFAYITTFATSLELYNLLFIHKDKVVVLDDVEGILTDKKSISILKSALWSSSGKREISYYSKTSLLDAPNKFEFSGKLIICINEIGNSRIIQALTSRCLFYSLEFDYEDKIELIEALGILYSIPSELIDFIKMNTSPATENLSMRTLIHIWNVYRYDAENGNSGKWREIAKNLLKTDENFFTLQEITNSGKPVNEQISDFIKRTGKSRRTYYYWKKGG